MARNLTAITISLVFAVFYSKVGVIDTNPVEKKFDLKNDLKNHSFKSGYFPDNVDLREYLEQYLIVVLNGFLSSFIFCSECS